MVQDDTTKYQGIVIAIKANYLIVKVKIEAQRSFSNFEFNHIDLPHLLCKCRGRLFHRGFLVNVGDSVALEAIDWDSHTAVISDVEPRKSWLNRPPVANVTEVVVVLSVSQPAFDFDQASRFLLTAEETGLKVSVILTKKDLISFEELTYYIESLKEWGYAPIPISIISGEGIDQFLNKLTSMKIAVLCGPSGVGKSSLLNFILPNESLTIGTISKRLGRGKHTTRFVQLYSLGGGGLIADTPGFNRPDLLVEPRGLANLFPEFRRQLQDSKCKFRDCLHRDEPGCSANKNWQRYQHYRELLEERINSRH